MNNAKVPTQNTDGASHSANRIGFCARCVQWLFAHWYPFTIPRLVTLINIKSLNGIAIRAVAHVLEKVRKSFPMVTNRYAATAVIFTFAASLNHGPPAFVSPRPILFTGASVAFWSVSASAACRLAVEQGANQNLSFCAAFAAAEGFSELYAGWREGRKGFANGFKLSKDTSDRDCNLTHDDVGIPDIIVNSGSRPLHRLSRLHLPKSTEVVNA